MDEELVAIGKRLAREYEDVIGKLIDGVATKGIPPEVALDAMLSAVLGAAQARHATHLPALLAAMQEALEASGGDVRAATDANTPKPN